MDDFNVVLEYKPTAASYSGCRFYVPFRDMADFVQWFDPDAQRSMSVVEAGVSEERADHLASHVDSFLLLKAWAETFRDKDGDIDVDLVRKQLEIYHLMQDRF